jgi:acyl carrier protein
MTSRGSSEVEAVIAAAWREVLRYDPIAPDDNFFDVGGDSASMLQICDLLRAQLQREVTMIELFEYPTVRGLTGYLVERAAIPVAHERIERRDARRRQAFGLGMDPGDDR